jgi:ubiquinone biosynthesis monooxygenase Coq7
LTERDNATMQRRYSLADRVLMRLSAPAPASRSDYPGGGVRDTPLPPAGRRHAAGLMRVNHAGEVAAQALYRGQALVARNPELRQHLLDAAREERAHLDWCEQRLTELGDRPSRLQPLWFAGSFAMGAVAGALGDRWNLGFVEETERQVVEHLDGHLERLPREDQRSRAVVNAMRADEARHGEAAHRAGARALPRLAREAMRRVARVMTGSAYWI